MKYKFFILSCFICANANALVCEQSNSNIVKDYDNSNTPFYFERNDDLSNNCDVLFESLGLDSNLLEISVKSRKKNIALTLLFDFDSSKLNEINKNSLKKFVMDNEVRDLIIFGFTDEYGTNQYNMRLGMRRAQSIKQHLIRLGWPEEKLVIISKGEADIISHRNQYLNRRGVLTW